MKKIIVPGAKSRVEEVMHIRIKLHRDYNDEFIIFLREVALEYLPPEVIAKVPPPFFSDQVRAAYQKKGISTEWNLTLGGDIGATGDYAFFFAARNADDLTVCQKNAAELLFACLEVLEKNTLSDHVKKNILDAYTFLDSDAVVTGNKFKAGRKLNTGSVIRKKIASLLESKPTLKNLELWSAVAKKPPRGWTSYDNHIGKYLEGPRSKDNMGYKRFCNVCGEERNGIKL